MIDRMVKSGFLVDYLRYSLIAIRETALSSTNKNVPIISVKLNERF